uniref:Uncharacterized protein n=1 Tax=Rhizophora mucronata TaxID=61149 RepID=A0A2P2LKJ9_RHIMU
MGPNPRERRRRTTNTLG